MVTEERKFCPLLEIDLVPIVGLLLVIENVKLNRR